MKNTYESPLNSRYASPEMQYLFSPDRKFTTWRRLWVALAESEMELGLPITQAQVDELKAHVDDIDYEAARRHEERVRHDVMAHVHAYGDVCPNARGIIHLGATSCYVTDNADVLMLRDALKLVREKVVEVLRRLRAFAWEYKGLPTLGYTHLQPAQLTTVGKRACLWMQDLTMDLEEIDFALSTLRLLGNRGATGTQVSFMELFDGDGAKVDELEARIARKMGMEKVFEVSGQTYPRKLDSRVLDALSGVAQSAGKSIMFEAQLGALRDINYGIYPFTSSSSPLAANAPVGCGLPSLKVDEVIGVTKAYSTCVGEGPFVGELDGQAAHDLREAGAEYGAATGRPRRVAWMDIVATRYGTKLQGATALALTKMDVLSYLDEIPVCVAYRLRGETIDRFPYTPDLYDCEPVYETLPGWKCDISGARRFEDLPKAAQDYVKFIEARVGCPIAYVSVGAERDALILRG